MRRAWRALGSQRDLTLLLSAGLVSMTGDWILRVGLAYHIYVLTGSTLASSMMLLASFLPQVLLGSVAGVFVDRWDHRRTMAAVNLLQDAGLLPLFLVNADGRVWLIYPVMWWQGCIQQFFTPAEQSLVPHLVPDERLVTANALNGQTHDVARLLGSAVGGVAVAAGGLALLTVCDLVSFAASAALIWRIRADRPTRPAAGAQPARTVRHRRRGAHGHSVRPVRARLPARQRQRLRRDRVGAGPGRNCRGRHRGPGRWSCPRLAVVRLGRGGLRRDRPGHVPLPAGLRLARARVHGPGRRAGRPDARRVHDAVAAAHRGRLFGALGALEGGALVIGAVAAGFLGETIGIIPVLAGQGAGYLLAGVAVVIALSPHRESGHATDLAAQTRQI